MGGTDRSITHQDTKLKFEINMAAGFSVKNIVANNLDVKMETTQSQTFHSVSACVCDEYIHVCKTAEENFELTQNMVYSLCLSATSSDVEVKAVNTLTIVQDGVEKFWPIAGQAPNSLSKVNYENGLAVVTTRSISSFFSISPPPEIKAVGEVELTFVSAQSSQRRLERKLQTDNESFEVDIRLGMSADEESGVGRVLRLFVSLMSPIAFIVAIVF